MNLTLKVMCLMMAVSLCSGYIGGSSSRQDVTPRFYCGRSLSRALSIICFTFDPTTQKRSETIYNPILSEYDDDSENNFPWLIQHYKARSLGYPSRGKRLVVSECCEKPCTINELLSYC